jgi:peptide subunit release factor 1 (eRF1)
MDLCCVQVNQITAPSPLNINKVVLNEGISVLFESPKKINISFYRCDNKFHLDDILDMFCNETLIGVCLLSGEELKIYNVSLTGAHVEPKLIKKLEIKLPNKQKKGGQSAVRFARNADIVRNQYVNKYSENIVSSYMTENNTKCNVSKIIIAGFGYMPDDVIETPLFQQYLKKYLYKKLSINSINDMTVVKIIQDLNIGMTEDLSKSVDTEIKTLVEQNSNMLGFGKTECMEFLESENVAKLFVNTNLINRETRDILIRYQYLEIVESMSYQLELYGGWLCVKKYNTEYTTY